MDEKENSRPSEVTTAAWISGLAGLVLLGSAISSILGINSLAVTNQLNEFLNGKNLGIDLETARAIFKYAAFACAGFSIATLILALFLRQREPSNRIGLLVSAGLAFLTSIFIDPFIGAVALVGATFLNRPASVAWFNGLPIPKPESSQTLAASDTNGFPSRVRQGCNLVWASSIAIVISTLAAIWQLFNQSEVVKETFESNEVLAKRMDYADFQNFLLASLVLIILWAITNAVLAWLTLRGQKWARITLLISIGFGGFFAIIAAFGAPIFLVLIFVFVMIFRLLLPTTNQPTEPPKGENW